MINSISIYCGGILTLMLAILHTRFYKLFDWKSAFKDIGPVNSKIFYTVHLALLLLLFLFGLISIINNKELAECSGLALSINLLLSLFWLWRLMGHFFYFRSEGNAKKPVIYHILTIWFILLLAAYSVPVLFTFTVS